MLKKYRGLLITLVLSIFITLVILYLNGVFDNTIFMSDLNAEYSPLLQGIGKGYLNLYNFQTALGDNFIGTFFYYMSSPLNVLSFFIKDINTLVITLILIKLSLASIFSYLLFKYLFKNMKDSYLIAFSLMYAISSFSLSYYLHIMWLDIYALFPLIILGVEKIINEQKYLLYIVSLILIIFCNYYFSYMIVIFSFIYYNYRLLVNKEDSLKKNKHFIILNLLIILSSSFILLPIMSEIGSYSRQNGIIFGNEDIRFTFNFKNIFKHFILGDYQDIELLNEHNFYLHTSIIMAPLIYLYFTNKKISIREKVFSLLMFLGLILSISCNYVNYMWHGFVPTSFFNGRYTFMFILFMLLIGLSALANLENKHLLHYLIIAFLLIGGTILLGEFTTFNVIKLVLLILLLIIIKYKISPIFFLSLIILELSINGYLYLDRFHFMSKEKSQYDEEKAIEFIKNYDDSAFYRIEDNSTDSSNFPIRYNYNGIDYFMSTVKKPIVNFLIKMDNNNHAYTKNTISYNGANVILSSLLNVKYHVETKGLTNNDYYKLSHIKDNIAVYQNPYALSLGFMVNSDILKTKLNDNGLQNLNTIYQDMSGKTIFTPITLTKKEHNYTFTNLDNKPFYLLINFNNWPYYSDFKVYVNNNGISDVNNTYLYNVTNSPRDVTISFSRVLEDMDNFSGIYAYYYDMDAFKEAIDVLKKNSLEINEVKDNYLKGEIDVKEKQILFTSIPYQKDLNIYVDGKKVSKIKLLDTFLGVKLDKGHHTITIKYQPKILYYSYIPSLIGIVLLILFTKKRCQ